MDAKQEKKRFNLFPLLPDEAFKSSNKEDIHLNLINSSSASSLDEKTKLLIARLLSIHYIGTLYINRVSNDVELRIPDPELLKIDGNKELYSQHLYVNVSKYLRDGHIAPARCVKTGQVYSIDKLLSMTKLEERKEELGWDPKRYLRHLKKRFIVPAHVDPITDEEYATPTKDILSPGSLVPLTQLPKKHPAVEYLKTRGFVDLKQLEDQFGCGFCTEENPQLKHLYVRDSEVKIKEFNPLKVSSPQGRIVFFAKHFGINTLWQARAIEQVIGNDKLYYQYMGYNHPETGFVKVAEKDPATGVTKFVNGFNKGHVNKKYLIAPGAKASNCILGFDAALEWNKKNKTIKKVIGIVEGVLDAARLGPPFCSIMGASVSIGQIASILNVFDKVYFLCDHDVAGEKLRISLTDNPLIEGRGIEVEEILYPEKYKDVGEITDDQLLTEIRSKLLSDNTVELEENDLIIC